MLPALLLASLALPPANPDVEALPSARPRPAAAPARAEPAVSPAELQLPPLAVTRTKLDDGLVVLTLEDHSLPSIALYLIFRVGSRNERPGITGLSHLFEHMMFNGSEKFPPKSFDRVIEAGGGYSNASTSWDVTDYIDEFSPAALDAVLEMEADRMRALKLDEQNLEQERGIVINERLLSVDNDVTGTLEERLWASAFLASPYRWPVIGWIADLRSGIRLEDARAYFRTYYAPNNAVMVLAGDFDGPRTLARIRELWAGVPAHEPPRAVLDPEPAQLGEQRTVVHREAQSPLLSLGYKVPGLGGPRAADLPALRLLGAVLGRGRSSRLYRRLVEETELCTSASVWVPEMAMTTLAMLSFELQPGKETAAVEREVEAILAALRDQGPTPAELERARTQLLAGFFRQLEGNQGRAARLGWYEAIHGDWAAMGREVEAYRRTTTEDLRRVAKTYFTPTNRTVATLVPSEAKDAVDVPASPPTASEPKEETR